MGIWAPSLNDVFEVFGSRSENINETAWSQAVTVRVPYNKAYALVNEIIGVNVRSPLIDYSNVAAPNLYLESATIAPIDDDSPSHVSGEYYLYKEADVTLVYTTVIQQQYDSEGDIWVPVEYLEVFEPRAEHQILDFKDYHWDSSGSEQPLKPEEAPARTLYSGTYTVYWFNKLAIPDEYYSLAGSVNSTAFTSPFLKFTNASKKAFQTAIQQMLYIPGGYSDSLEWKDPSKTVKGYNYICKWLLKTDGSIIPTGDNTWNKFYRKTASGPPPVYEYDNMVLKEDESTDYDVYRVKDHTPLLPI